MIRQVFIIVCIVFGLSLIGGGCESVEEDSPIVPVPGEDLPKIPKPQ